MMMVKTVIQTLNEIRSFVFVQTGTEKVNVRIFIQLSAYILQFVFSFHFFCSNILGYELTCSVP